MEHIYVSIGAGAVLLVILWVLFRPRKPKFELEPKIIGYLENTVIDENGFHSKGVLTPEGAEMLSDGGVNRLSIFAGTTNDPKVQDVNVVTKPSAEDTAMCIFAHDGIHRVNGVRRCTNIGCVGYDAEYPLKQISEFGWKEREEKADFEKLHPRDSHGRFVSRIDYGEVN